MVKSTSRSTTRDQAINIRANRRERDVIDQAAQVLGKSRSDFMLDTAYREATQVLLDRAFFPLESPDFDSFADLIDTPPPATDELRNLLRAKTPWQ